MKKLVFSLLIVIWSVQGAQSQPIQHEIVFESDFIKINGHQIKFGISVMELNDILGEKGAVVNHRKKRFKDKHHGTKHVIPAYVEIIYNESGLIFFGKNEDMVSKLQINFCSKELTEKYIQRTLEEEFELKKDDSGFILTKEQAFKEIYVDTFRPFTKNQFSGSLFISSNLVETDSPLFKPEEEINLYQDAFFDTIIFDKKYSCMVPVMGIVEGFCECSSSGLQFILYKNMKLHSLKYRFKTD